ncbi:putative Ubiquitin carboxyl-terminal hydrolase 47 [Blattamonas nauphoetae]|uniref:Ubiquitin carboxyl-terminal hydrolase 47 n=1 Tax=Blattamonas nauphoetae TaxID=2049346 RepID=A0ABQ9YGE9_9EUKA|nr:putative Ubiquitin carboxyl-terminal hydrolase 47 [Blattamonas nauphoetae]
MSVVESSTQTTTDQDSPVGVVGNLFGQDNDFYETTPIQSTSGGKLPHLHETNRAPSNFVGLQNQGATCYLNSLIQLYFMTPELRSSILSLTQDDLSLVVLILSLIFLQTFSTESNLPPEVNFSKLDDFLSKIHTALEIPHDIDSFSETERVEDFLNRPLERRNDSDTLGDDGVSHDDDHPDSLNQSQLSIHSSTPTRNSILKKKIGKTMSLLPTTPEQNRELPAHSTAFSTLTPLVDTPETSRTTPSTNTGFLPSDMLSSPFVESNHPTPSRLTVQQSVEHSVLGSPQRDLAHQNHLSSTSNHKTGSGRVWRTITPSSPTQDGIFSTTQLPTGIASPSRSQYINKSSHQVRSKSVDPETSPSMNYSRVLDILSADQQQLSDFDFEESTEASEHPDSSQSKLPQPSLSLANLDSTPKPEAKPKKRVPRHGVAEERHVQFVEPALEEREDFVATSLDTPVHDIVAGAIDQTPAELLGTPLSAENTLTPINNKTSVATPTTQNALPVFQSPEDSSTPGIFIPQDSKDSPTRHPLTLTQFQSPEERIGSRSLLNQTETPSLNPLIVNPMKTASIPTVSGIPPTTPFLNSTERKTRSTSLKTKMQKNLLSPSSTIAVPKPESIAFLSTSPDGLTDLPDSHNHFVMTADLPIPDQSLVDLLSKTTGFRVERCKAALRASDNNEEKARIWLEQHKSESLVDLIIKTNDDLSHPVPINIQSSSKPLDQISEDPAPVEEPIQMNPLMEIRSELDAFLKELNEQTPQPISTAPVSYSCERKIPFELQRLFCTLLSSPAHSTTTTALTNSFGWSNSEAANQQDILELNHLLLDALEIKLKGTRLEDMIDTNFKGLLSNRIKCLECGYESKNQEEFRDLSVPLIAEERKGSGDDDKSTLDRCLVEMMQGELLSGDNQYRCSGCEQKVDAQRYSVLTSIPPLLTIDLMRFSYDWERDARVKTSSFISFPFFLDMEPYMVKDDTSATSNDVPLVVSEEVARNYEVLRELKQKERERLRKMAELAEERLAEQNAQIKKEEKILSKPKPQPEPSPTPKQNPKPKKKQATMKADKPWAKDMKKKKSELADKSWELMVVEGVAVPIVKSDEGEELLANAFFTQEQKAILHSLDSENKAVIQSAPSLVSIPLPEVNFHSPFLYELCGVVIHSGGAYGGHYHVLIRDLMEEGSGVIGGHKFETTKEVDDCLQKVFGNWYDFNDSNVYRVSPLTVQTTFSGASNSAYIMLYRQCSQRSNFITESIVNRIPTFDPSLLPDHLRRDCQRQSAVHKVEHVLKSLKMHRMEYSLYSTVTCQLGKFIEDPQPVKTNNETDVIGSYHLREDFSKRGECKAEWELDIRTSVQTCALDLFRSLRQIVKGEDWEEAHVYTLRTNYSNGGHFKVDSHFASFKRTKRSRGKDSIEVLFPSSVKNEDDEPIRITPNSQFFHLNFPGTRTSLLVLPTAIEDAAAVSEFDISSASGPVDHSKSELNSHTSGEKGKEEFVTIRDIKTYAYSGFGSNTTSFFIIPVPLPPDYSVSKAESDPKQVIDQLKHDGFYSNKRTQIAGEGMDESVFEVSCPPTTSLRCLKTAIRLKFCTIESVETMTDDTTKEANKIDLLFTHKSPQIFFSQTFGGCGAEVEDDEKSLRACKITNGLRLFCFMEHLGSPVPVPKEEKDPSKFGTGIHSLDIVVEVGLKSEQTMQCPRRVTILINPQATLTELREMAAVRLGLNPNFTQMYNTNTFRMASKLLTKEALPLDQSGITNDSLLLIQEGPVPLAGQISVNVSLLVKLDGSPLDPTNFPFTPVHIKQGSNLNTPSTVLPGRLPSLLQVGDAASSVNTQKHLNEAEHLPVDQRIVSILAGDLHLFAEYGMATKISISAPVEALNGYPMNPDKPPDHSQFVQTVMPLPAGIDCQSVKLCLAPPPPPFYLLPLDTHFYTSVNHSLDTFIENVMRKTFPKLFSMVLRKIDRAKKEGKGDSATVNVRVYEMKNSRVKRLIGKVAVGAQNRKEPQPQAVLSDLQKAMQTTLCTGSDCPINSIPTIPAHPVDQSLVDLSDSCLIRRDKPTDAVSVRLLPLSRFNIIEDSHIAIEIVDEPIDIEHESRATATLVFLFELVRKPFMEPYLSSVGPIVFDKAVSNPLSSFVEFLSERVGVSKETLVVASFTQLQGKWQLLHNPESNTPLPTRNKFTLKDGEFVMFCNLQHFSHNPVSPIPFSLDLLSVSPIDHLSNPSSSLIVSLMGRSALGILHPQVFQRSSGHVQDSTTSSRPESGVKPKARHVHKVYAEPSLRISLN